MRIQLFPCAVLLVVVSQEATAQEPVAREPDLIAAPRLIPPNHDLTPILPPPCLTTDERTKRVLGGTLGGYMIGALLGWTQTAKGLHDGQPANARARKRATALKLTGTVVGFLGGLVDVEREKQRRCPAVSASKRPVEMPDSLERSRPTDGRGSDAEPAGNNAE